MIRHVFIMKDGRALVFADQKGASEWLKEVFPVNWPETVLREEGEHTWERLVPSYVWCNSEKRSDIVWQYYV